MKRTLVSIILFLIVIASVIAGAVMKRNNDNSNLTKVKVAEVAHSIFYAPQYAAISNGYFEEEGLDIFAIDKEFTHYCPNPEMAYRTTVDDFKDGKLYLTKQPLRLVDGKWKNDEYWKPEHIICKIFRKGKNNE